MDKIFSAVGRAVIAIGGIPWKAAKNLFYKIPDIIIGLSIGAAIIAACFLLALFLIMLACYPLQVGAAIFIYQFVTYKPAKK